MTDWAQFTPVDPMNGASGNVDWDQFEPVTQDTSSDVVRGFKESFQQLPQLGYGVLAGVGAAGESAFGEGGISSGLKKAGIKGYTEWGDKIASGAKESDSWSNSYELAKQGDFGALADWLQHGIGYVAGQGAQVLMSAGIGAVGGKFVLGKAAEQLASGMVAKETARLASENVGKQIAADEIGRLAVRNVASKLGQAAAVGAMATGQEGGEIFGGLTQANPDRVLSGAELGKAFGATLVAGGLEFVGDKLGLDVMLGKSRLLKPAQYMPGVAGRAARGIIAGAAVTPAEALTEYAQTGVEEYGKGTESSPLPWQQSEANRTQAFDAAMLGGLGGSVVGGAGGLLHGAKARPKEGQPPASIEDIATAPTVDDAITAASRAVSGEPTRGERVANIRGELSDRAIVGDLRTKYGDDGFSQLLTSLNQANDPRTPEATREKHLQAVETALFNLRASVDRPAQTALLEGQQAMPMLTGPDGLPLLGDVSTPTGTMRAGPDGVAVPETAADLTETMRARDERTSLGEQQGQMPDDVIPMGMRQEQPAWTNPRSKTPEPTIIDALNVPNAVNAYVDKQRAINTPMAHAFVQAFDSGKITPADVAKLIVPAQQETPNDRIAAAAATAPQTLQQRLEAFRRAPDATTIETPVVASRPRPKGAPDAIGGAGTVQDMAQGQPEQAGQPAAAPAPGSANALPVGVQPEPDAALTNQPAPRSWVIREKATGKVIMETFDRKKVDALNTAKYEAVPIQQHLASLNRPQGEPEQSAGAGQAVETGETEAHTASNATALLADLTARNEPVPPALRVQSRKESDGRYGLYFTGTNNEVWKGERFKSPKEARSTLEAVRAVGMPTAAPVIPRSFRRSQKVTTQVFDEASGKMQPAELDADTALRALNEDISALEAFLKCIG